MDRRIRRLVGYPLGCTDLSRSVDKHRPQAGSLESGREAEDPASSELLAKRLEGHAERVEEVLEDVSPGEERDCGLLPVARAPLRLSSHSVLAPGSSARGA